MGRISANSARNSALRRAVIFACAVTAAMLLYRPALAEQAVRRFSVNVGETTIADGLRALQKSTGAKLIFSPDQLRTIRTRGVVGEMTVQEALDHLLEGSGFEAQVTGDGTYVIVSNRTARLRVPTGTPFMIETAFRHTADHREVTA